MALGAGTESLRLCVTLATAGAVARAEADAAAIRADRVAVSFFTGILRGDASRPVWTAAGS
jgi:hypothetical protein